MASPNNTPDQENWKDRYSGREGYRMMLEEVTTSFFTAFPELKDKVAIYNFMAPDQEAELARVRGTLNLKASDQSLTSNGLDLAAPTEDRTTVYDPESKGDFRAVVWGTDPNRLPRLTPDDIDSLAWHLTHEMNHAADAILNKSYSKEAQTNSTANQSSEGLADSVRLALFRRNGQDAPGFMYDYDLSSPLAVQDLNAGGSPVSAASAASEEPEYLVGSAVNGAYDNGALLRITRHETPLCPVTQSYAFNGWRESFDQMTSARERLPAFNGTQYQYETASSIALLHASRSFQDDAVKELSDKHAETIKRKLDMTPEEFVQASFLDKAVYSKDIAPELTEPFAVLRTHQDNFLKWVEARQDIYPQAGRMLEAQRFYRDGIDLYNPKPKRSDSLTSMARSAEKFLETGDMRDKRATEIFSGANDGAMSSEEKAELLPKLYQNPDLLKTYAHPETARSVSLYEQHQLQSEGTLYQQSLIVPKPTSPAKDRSLTV